MPKESKTPVSTYTSFSAPYPPTSSSVPRSTAIWSSGDDEILLQARASGLNWQPIASKHFPNKTPNACRKRHERLIERRNVEDWDAHKLELLAQEYVAVRKEMWEILAARLGERWAVVEAKCMEKGIKTLQTTARMGQRKAAADSRGLFDEQGIPDHTSDSGIGLGSDAEMEVDDGAGPSVKASSWHADTHAENKRHTQHQDHTRSRSLPHPLKPLQPLPLYQPPPPPLTAYRSTFDRPMTTSPATVTFTRPATFQRYSPEAQNGRGGLSIQSMLSPA